MVDENRMMVAADIARRLKVVFVQNQVMYSVKYDSDNISDKGALNASDVAYFPGDWDAVKWLQAAGIKVAVLKSGHIVDDKMQDDRWSDRCFRGRGKNGVAGVATDWLASIDTSLRECAYVAKHTYVWDVWKTVGLLASVGGSENAIQKRALFKSVHEEGGGFCEFADFILAARGIDPPSPTHN